jgi:hypothetical protein
MTHAVAATGHAHVLVRGNGFHRRLRNGARGEQDQYREQPFHQTLPGLAIGSIIP